ncbi:MAG: YitT family protein [Alistipes sp.]|nr:YitT family protein [Alistipes sp.]
MNANLNTPSWKTWSFWRAMLLIFLGCSIMGTAYVLFINPYNFVPGGVYGLAIVMHNIFPSIQVGTFSYMFDIPLMIIALLIFGSKFGFRTVVAASYTPGFMNVLTNLVYPNEAAVESLDPALLLGGNLNFSNDLLMAALLGALLTGIGMGIVVRQQATTGGTDIVAMLLQKYVGVKFSKAIFYADGFVVVAGLLVIGFGFLIGEPDPSGWLLTIYSLVIIYCSSRVLAYALDGASYDKLLFIISDQHAVMKEFIIHDLDRSATYIRSRGMYTDAEREMIFLVVSRKEVRRVQQQIKKIDPRAFVVVTDAYDTYGEGFKAFPEENDLQAE